MEQVEPYRAVHLTWAFKHSGISAKGETPLGAVALKNRDQTRPKRGASTPIFIDKEFPSHFEKVTLKPASRNYMEPSSEI